MTPYEVEQVIECDYITPLTCNGFFHSLAIEHLDSYEAFAGHIYPFIDVISERRELEGEQKIGYVKARVATAIWFIYNGDLDDSGYVGARHLILRNCRLTAPIRYSELDNAIAYGFSQLSSTPESTPAMSLNTSAFITVSYVYGRAVNLLSEAELIAAIKRAEKEIDDLDIVDIKSTKVSSKINELQTMLAQIVAILDAK